MPLFYFNVFNDEVTLDDEGMDLPDTAAARALAVKEARVLLCDGVLKGRINLGHRIDVTDEAGKVVASVSFGEAIAIEE